MIGYIGPDMTQEERNALREELEAFFDYVEDPDSDLNTIFAIEEALEVTHP